MLYFIKKIIKLSVRQSVCSTQCLSAKCLSAKCSGSIMTANSLNLSFVYFPMTHNNNMLIQTTVDTIIVTHSDLVYQKRGTYIKLQYVASVGSR